MRTVRSIDSKLLTNDQLILVQGLYSDTQYEGHIDKHHTIQPTKHGICPSSHIHSLGRTSGLHVPPSANGPHA